MRRRLVRMTGLGTAAAAALALGAMVAPAEAVTHDPVPARQAGNWLAGQLSGSGMMYDNEHGYFNVGRTIDAALELAALGHDPAVQQTTDTVERFIPSYTEGNGYFQADNTPTTAYYANQTAKALVFAEVAGRDLHNWGHTDLLDNLELMVDSNGSAGRLHDWSTEDRANTYGQALAVRGLAAAHSSKTRAATEFLLSQQCGAGYFSRDMGDADSTTGFTCDDRQARPDADATAYTVLQLTRLAHPMPAVLGAVSHARAWLEQVQRTSGAWSRVPGGGANAMSTGLAVRALAGTTSAERGAVWLRNHQVRDAGVCAPTLRQDRGAVGFTSSAYAAERRHGITRAAQDQWRATAIQALLALRELPGATAPIQLTTARRAVAAGDRITARVRHAAPYSQVCVTVGKHHVAGSTGAAGRATVRIVVPKGQAHRRLTVVDSDGRRDTLRLTVHRR